MSDRKRREFITLVGGAAMWPLAARAQQGERMRRIGVLMSMPADDPEGQARLTGFLQGLQELGWTAGRNARIDYRWAADDAGRPKYAAEESKSRSAAVLHTRRSICESSVRLRSINPWVPGPNGRHEADYFRRRGCSPSCPSLSLIVKN